MMPTCQQTGTKEDENPAFSISGNFFSSLSLWKRVGLRGFSGETFINFISHLTTENTLKRFLKKKYHVLKYNN